MHVFIELTHSFCMPSPPCIAAWAQVPPPSANVDLGTMQKTGECMPARAPPFPAAIFPSSPCLRRILVTLRNLVHAVLTCCTLSRAMDCVFLGGRLPGLHPCESVMLQMEALSFAYIDRALHAVHRRGGGGFEALGGPHGPHPASFDSACHILPE